MKRASILASALLAATTALAAPPPAQVQVITDNNASCDIGYYAAATLLLPHFEVDYTNQNQNGINTIFTVINTSRQPQIARVTIWSDLGFPVTYFNMFLTGYDAQTVSMYEIIARGNFPITMAGSPTGAMSADNAANANHLPDIPCERMGGTTSPAGLRRLQQILTTGQRDEPGCRVGLTHKNAVGYVTIDVVNSCAAESILDPEYWQHILLYDNVLTGDYERINPDPQSGNYAGGSPLVHIRAVPDGGAAGSDAVVNLPYTFYDRYTPANARKSDRRQPLPSAFAARFIEGGPTGFVTNFAVWREGVVGATRSECAYAANEKLPVNRASVVRFDEHENPTTVASTSGSATLPIVSSISTSGGDVLPPAGGSGDVAGWVWMSLDHGIGRSDKTPYSILRPSQGWVMVQMYAEGRYAVDFEATTLVNGCTVANAPAAP